MHTSLKPRVAKAALAAGLDPLLIEAIIEQESGGKPSAFRFEPGFWRRYLKANPTYAHEDPVRVASSYGLMQLMYPTAVEVGYRGEPEGLFDITTNLQYGCKFFKKLLHSVATVREALAAYNGGLGNREAPGPRAYATRVLARYVALQQRA